MAGTFTVVGLAAAALIAGLIFFLVKRHRKLRDEEEVDSYFDKLPALGQHHGGTGRDSTDLMPHPGSNAYHGRDVQYGSSGLNYDQRNYALDYPPDMASLNNSRPGSVAPGTAYAAAMAQEGPYQYTGRSAHGHDASPAPRGGVTTYSPFDDPFHQVGRQAHDEAYAQ